MPKRRLNRRDFIASGVVAALAAGRAGRLDAGRHHPDVSIRQISRGPKHHWFGYYDKMQFDPTGRYVLGMEVDFEHRSPRADDRIKIGMVDLYEGDRWIELGESRAWCWQQGCMLQWLPQTSQKGSAGEIVWNDRIGDRFVARIMDVQTRKTRTLPHAIYCVSPDGKHAVAPDFRRINDVPSRLRIRRAARSTRR